MKPETITLDPNVIGTMDKASKEVLNAEKKIEKEHAEQKRIQKDKKKTRGRSTSVNEVKKKDSVYDEKTREKLREVALNKTKLRRIEKQKLKSEQEMIKGGDIMEGFDPLATVKKVKKL